MKRKLLYHGLFICILIILTISARAQDAKTLEKVQNLKMPSLKNKITVYYSPEFKKRAKEIQPLIEDAMRFYEWKLNLKVDLSVAVLDKAQWQEITPIPYGLPWVSDAPHVAFLPATADGVVASDTLKMKEFFTPAMLQKIKSSGFTFEQAAEKTVDLIGLHELGHTYARQIGIVPPRPNKWFNEFMASYFAYAYLREKRPKLATLFHTMTADMASVTPKQKHTTLDDFERLYVEVGAANYGWYQGKFFERVAQVYDVKGVSFIEEVYKTFPADEKRRIQDTRDRLWLNAYDARCAERLTADLHQTKTFQTPTLAINRNYSYLDEEPNRADPHRQWIPAKFLAYWDALRAETLAGYGTQSVAAWRFRYKSELDLVRQFSKSKIKILAGSDATDWEPFIYPGASLHDELALLVEAGLTPFEALETATVNPANFLGRKKKLGTIEKGKLADLVLLDANPLENIGNSKKIAAVVFDGKYFSKSDLENLLIQAEILAAKQKTF